MKAEKEEIKVQVLQLRGELNIEDVGKICNLLSDYLRAGLVHVVIDLDRVTHIHLAALPMLVNRADRLHAEMLRRIAAAKEALRW